MGGGGGDHGHGHGHGDFRNKVWSMSGGPYCRPKHWKRNTAIAMFGVVLICIPIAMKSAELEVVLSWTLFHSLFQQMSAILNCAKLLRNESCNNTSSIMLNSNDHITLFAPSLLNSGARTLELKTIMIMIHDSSIASLFRVPVSEEVAEDVHVYK
ncbi:hypothetical protein HKD37_09G026690 [Glycine soja]